MLFAGDIVVAENGDLRPIVAVLAVVATGTIEGAAVGLAQFAVLGRTFASLTRRAWLVSTIAGAILAWACGMAIGQLAGDAFTSAGTDTPVAAALVIGAVAGALLAAPQWIALRRARVDADWWIPAHSFGWAAGMIVAFAGVASLPSDAAFVFTAIAMAGTGFGMGALVAMVTGLAVVDAARVRPVRSPATR